MGDNGKEINSGVDTGSQPSDLILTIKLKPDGNIEINGMLTKEMELLYMLDKARDLIKGYNIQQKLNQNKIIAPKHSFRDFLRRK